MDILQLIPIIIKINIIVESFLFLSYCLAYYLTYISSIHNGLNRSLSATFISGILYTSIWVYYLVTMTNYNMLIDKPMIYIFLAFVIARLLTLISRFFLMHELRIYALRRKNGSK